MTFALPAICCLIYLIEVALAFRIVRRYTEHGEFEEFITRAPLDQVLLVRGHILTGFLMLQMATILTLMVNR